MIQFRLRLILSLAFLHLNTPSVQGDGAGLIGFGKTLYNPTCTFACRNVIRKQTLSCTPSSSQENHGTSHNPVVTPPKCFVQDLTFLKTMALCIDVYCTLSDDPATTLIEDYWTAHLGTGTLGTTSMSQPCHMRTRWQLHDRMSVKQGRVIQPALRQPQYLKAWSYIRSPVLWDLLLVAAVR
jgi:hypothetical protein